MTSYRLARFYLIGFLSAVALAAGLFLYYDYQRVLETEELEFFESQTRLKNQLATRAQEGFAKNLLALVATVRRIMQDSGEPFSKGLQIIETSHPEVRRAFYADQSMIFLPQWQKFRIPKNREITSLSLGEKAEFKLAEILEYQDQDYAGAIRLYETFWLNNPDDLSAANALARCRTKLKQWEQAEKIYRQIYAQNPLPLSPDEVPLALTAAFQLLFIYQTLHQADRLKEFGTVVFEDLMNEKWELTQDMSDFVRNKLLTLLEDYLQEPRFQKLQNRNQQLDAYKKYVRFISNRVLPLIDNLPIEHFKVHFLSTSPNAASFLLIIPFQSGHLILDMNVHRFLEIHLQSHLESLARDYPAVGLQVFNNGQPELTASAAAGLRVTYALSKFFPDLTLELTLPALSTAAEQGRRRQRLVFFAGGYGVFVGLLILIGFVVQKQMQLAEMKSDFVSHVSHELKTPLTSLRMFSEMLLHQPRITPAKRRQYHDVMHGETLRLARLIENLLDLSRIEGKKIRYHLQPENLNAVLRSALQIFKNTGASSRRRVLADLRTPRLLPLDRDAMVQMTLNLLDNARKFSDENTPIRVRSWFEQDTACLAVTDHGIGLSRSEARNVFKKFYQVKRSYEDRFKGVGLGLTIVQHIVYAHGGRIAIESEPGRGTTMTVRLPGARDSQSMTTSQKG